MSVDSLTKVLLVLALWLAACSPSPSPPLRNWYKSIPLGKEQGTPDQPMFVYFSASWCVVCDRMEKEVLQSTKVKMALEPYSLVNIDIDTQPKTARAFNIIAVPAYVVLDGKGKLRAQSIGYQEADELAAKLQAASVLLEKSE